MTCGLPRATHVRYGTDLGNRYKVHTGQAQHCATHKLASWVANRWRKAIYHVTRNSRALCDHSIDLAVVADQHSS